jgi:hypothetical protein
MGLRMSQGNCLNLMKGKGMTTFARQGNSGVQYGLLP